MTAQPIGPPGDRYLEDFIREASAQPLPHHEEEAYLEGRGVDVVARERLVRAHLRTVVDEAVQHRGFGLATSELVRLGMRGLLEGAESFDPERGATFAEHVRGSIRVAIRRAVFGARPA